MLRMFISDVQYKILSIFTKKIINGKLKKKKRSSTVSCWERVLGEGKGRMHPVPCMAGKGFFTNSALSPRLKNSP